MNNHYQLIKLFQLLHDEEENNASTNAVIKWYRASTVYSAFQKDFLTRRRVNPEDLWIVYEHFGDLGNFYDVTELTWEKSAFKVVRDLITSERTLSKDQIETYLETITTTDVYLLGQFKYLNDLYKNKEEELHIELYQPDLDARIKKYLTTYRIKDTIFDNTEGHHFAGSYDE